MWHPVSVSRMTQGERSGLPRRSRSVPPKGTSRPGGPRRDGDDRYRRGARRTTAEPLAAQWEPEPDAESKPRSRRRREGTSGFIATYGWRVYALPLLALITTFILVKTSDESGVPTDLGPTNAASTGGGAVDEPTGDAPVDENPATPIDVNIPTAELPPGSDFLQAGPATWHVVPGTTEKTGSGRLYTYSIEIEDGIDAAAYGGEDGFANSVAMTLADPRGWTSGGQIAVQRVDPAVQKPDFRVSLTTPGTAHRTDYCGQSIKYESSCWRRSQGRVVINVARWVRGALAFDGDIGLYRQYAINHEVGHAFNKQHVGCAGDGELAPVMMQQSFGVSNDYIAELNKVDENNKDAVPADHKVCKANAWPNPQAKPAG